jgi:hypothetical protein
MREQPREDVLCESVGQTTLLLLLLRRLRVHHYS